MDKFATCFPIHVFNVSIFFIDLSEQLQEANRKYADLVEKNLRFENDLNDQKAKEWNLQRKNKNLIFQINEVYHKAVIHGNSNIVKTLINMLEDKNPIYDSSGHSITTWTRGGGEGVNQMFMLLHKPY